MIGVAPCRVVCVVLGWLALLAVDAKSSPVRVTIWENLPKNWTWQAPPGDASETFDWPALGFVRLPLKYNTRGIAVERSAPFALSAETTIERPAGSYRLILRGRNASRLFVDDRIVARTQPINPNSSGHEEVHAIAPPEDLRWRFVATGDQEAIVDWESDGKPHKVSLWVLIGEKKMRQETGELSVALVAAGEIPKVIGGDILLTDEGWSKFSEKESARIDALDTSRRRASAHAEDAYWAKRHEIAREEALKSAPGATTGEGNLVDQFTAETLKAAGERLPDALNDAAFFRRLSLDTIGVIPDGRLRYT